MKADKMFGESNKASRGSERMRGGAWGRETEKGWPTIPREEVEGEEEEEEEGCRRLCWEEEQEEASFCKKAPADTDVM